MRRASPESSGPSCAAASTLVTVEHCLRTALDVRRERPRRRGWGARPHAEKEIERLRRENATLEEKLRRSLIIVEAQKKLAEVLVSLAPSTSERSG